MFILGFKTGFARKVFNPDISLNLYLIYAFNSFIPCIFGVWCGFLVILSEIHQCLLVDSPDVHGYRWMPVCRANHRHQAALKDLEWLCCTKRRCMIWSDMLCIRMQMHGICGYKSKETTFGNSILWFAKFHPPTQGLRLSENHHIYHCTMIL